MRLDPVQFRLGVMSMLKSAQLGGGFMESHTAGENILPYLESQRKWRYARHPQGIRLSDGTHVWSFDMPEFAAETGRATRAADPNILSWESGASERGTAQVHRSSPDSIYLTLHNGRENPTFHLEHMEGKNWKYIPGKKLRERLLQRAAESSQVEINPESLLEGGVKAAMDFGLGANDMNRMLWKGIDLVKGHPLLAAGALLGGGYLAHRLLKKPRPEAQPINPYTQAEYPPQF